MQSKKGIGMKHTENELADKRHECQTFSELLIWGIDAEEKLRQQQAEIDSLKKEIQNQSLNDLMDWQQELDTSKTLSKEKVREIYCECMFGGFDPYKFAELLLKKDNEK